MHMMTRAAFRNNGMANAVARALTARGLARGDRVAILSANRFEYLTTVHGIMRAGFVAVPVNFKFPPATIERLLRLRWWELELSELSGLPFRDIERCLDRLEEIRSRRCKTE